MADHVRSLFCRAALTCVILIGAVNPLLAQLPSARLGSVFPPGANPGKSVVVTLGGEDLDDVAELRFSHPGITAKQKLAAPGPFDKGPVPVPNQFEVTVAANVPHGAYDVRAVGLYGISNPRAFTVGDQPETVEEEPNDSRETATEVSLPCVLNGQSDKPTDVDWYKITGVAGQRLLLDCRARRIDSLMDPVVSVFDGAGRELDSSRDNQAGDPLVDFTVPAAGDYYIRVHDSVYRANDGRRFFFYRLSVGALAKIDFVFPPAGLPGSNGPFTVYGRNLPGGQPAGLTVQGKPLQKLSVSISIPAAAAQTLAWNSRIDPESSGLDGVEYRIPGPQGLSNSVLIGAATGPVVLEAEPNSAPDTAQKLTTPCEVAGQFYPRRDDDWFRFDVKEKETYFIEVISQRLGADTDPLLLVQEITADAEGKPVVKELATIDDVPVPDAGAAFDIRNDDPSYRFVAVNDATCQILLRDSPSGIQSDPRAVYRLSIRKEQPDFRLAAAPLTPSGGIFLRKGGSEAIQVVALRRDGFAGEITVTAAGLPAGVTCAPIVLGPTQTAGLLVVTAADNAAPNVAAVQVSGKATIAGAEAVRAARAGTLIWPLAPRQNNQQAFVSGESRVCSEIPVSVSKGEIAPVHVAAGQEKVWETSRAGIVKIPFTIARRGDFKGDVSLLPRDLPANVPAPVVNVNGATAAGEYELRLNAATPVGTYTFFLDAFAPNVAYARNPESAKVAADRKVEIDKFNTEAIAAAKTALDAKQAADKLLADMTAVSKTSETAKAAADKAAADADAAHKAAVVKAAQAKTAAAANAGDAALGAAATAAEKAATDAAALLKTMTDAAVAAGKKLEESLAAVKTATDAKVKTDKANDDAIAFAKLAADTKVQTDQLAANLANAAKPAPRNLFFPSTPVTLKVTDAPLTLAVTPLPAALKQGMTSEVPVTITRLYAYAEAVNLNVVIPPGLAGVSIPNVAIPAGQTAGKLMITAAANATDGKHDLIVRASFAVNGQQLIVDQPLPLTIEKVEAAK